MDERIFARFHVVRRAIVSTVVAVFMERTEDDSIPDPIYAVVAVVL